MSTEKKTIGSFIAALRRANGMTQKDLGERLFVSDKTVSRWERGECDPDLALIPAIADLFGVTTDELLRGEKRAQDTVSDTAQDNRRSLRAYRQLLARRRSRFRWLSLISVGLCLLGILLGLFSFISYDTAWLVLVILGLSALAAAVIVQSGLIFTFLLPTDSESCAEDGEDGASGSTEELSAARKNNRHVIRFSSVLITVSLTALTAIADRHLVFEYLHEVFYVIIPLCVLVLLLLARKLILLPSLRKKGIIPALIEAELTRRAATRRIFKWALPVAAGLFVVFGLLFWWVDAELSPLDFAQNSLTFESEEAYDAWCRWGNGSTDVTAACINPDGSVRAYTSQDYSAALPTYHALYDSTLCLFLSVPAACLVLWGVLSIVYKKKYPDRST